MGDTDWKKERLGVARTQGFVWLVVTYVSAALGAAWVASLLGGAPPLVVALGATLAAALVIYLFAFGVDNASLMDPLWFVMPIGLVWVLQSTAQASTGSHLRQNVVLALILAWGLRRLFHWSRGWRGMDHESWRVRGMKSRFGFGYWAGALLFMAFVPAVLIFLLCMPLFPANLGADAVGGYDWLAAILAISGILFQAVSDKLLFVHRNLSQSPKSGPFSVSKHPSYIGEVLFWVGMFFFGLGARGEGVWAGFGLMVFLFYLFFVVLPQLDQHLESGRPGQRKWA